MSDHHSEATAKAHIFLIDDDPVVLGMLQTGIAAHGYRVDAFLSPGEALEAYQKGCPDLVVLDVIMPEINGVELARAMWRMAHRPILVLSEHSGEPYLSQAIAAGVAGYFVKPLSAEELVPNIETALARFNEVHAMMQSTEAMRERVESNRAIATAVGVIMERARLGADAAFEHLRHQARSQRRPLRDLAKEVVETTERLNGLVMPDDSHTN